MVQSKLVIYNLLIDLLKQYPRNVYDIISDINHLKLGYYMPISGDFWEEVLLDPSIIFLDDDGVLRFDKALWE